MNGEEFTTYLLQEAGVAVVPGSALAKGQPIRFAFPSMEQLQKTVSKIKSAVEKLSVARPVLFLDIE